MSNAVLIKNNVFLARNFHTMFTVAIKGLLNGVLLVKVNSHMQHENVIFHKVESNCKIVQQAYAFALLNCETIDRR